MSIEYPERWNRHRRDGVAYKTKYGTAYQSRIEDFIRSPEAKKLRGKVQLIVTSPPFPLLRPKRYGNSQGQEYIDWISEIACGLVPLLKNDGSLVIEIGNSWNSGEPTMSTVPLKALISISETAGLNICQQFICNNPARLPGPASWVTRERIRVKDSYTHVWWLSPATKPKANNRNVLQPYSSAMLKLIKNRHYNAGHRPSDHRINPTSFLADNGGAIPSSVFNFGNTAISKSYINWCKEKGVRPHPARMQSSLVEFFISFLTDEKDLVLDPFGGSNTTGEVAESKKRRWVSVEADSDYVLGSVGRFL